MCIISFKEEEWEKKRGREGRKWGREESTQQNEANVKLLINRG